MRKYDWKGWGFYLGLILLPAIVVFVSAYRLFPHMRWMTGLLLLITVGIGLLTHRMTLEPTAWLRQLGISVGLSLTIVHAADLIAHVAYARDADAALLSTNERHAEDQHALQMEKARTALKMQEAEAETRRLDSARKVLTQVPSADKGALANRLLIPQTTPSATPSATPAADANHEEPAKVYTAEEIRAWWQPILLGLLILGVATSLIGGAIVQAARHWDENGDGLPDWMQSLSEADIQSRYPGYLPAWHAWRRSALSGGGPNA